MLVLIVMSILFYLGEIGEIKGGDISDPGKKWWAAWLQFAYLRHPNVFSEQLV